VGDLLSRGGGHSHTAPSGAGQGPCAVSQQPASLAAAAALAGSHGKHRVPLWRWEQAEPGQTAGTQKEPAGNHQLHLLPAQCRLQALHPFSTGHSQGHAGAHSGPWHLHTCHLSHDQLPGDSVLLGVGVVAWVTPPLPGSAGQEEEGEGRGSHLSSATHLQQPAATLLGKDLM
jgi:hypothetical protein